MTRRTSPEAAWAREYRRSLEETLQVCSVLRLPRTPSAMGHCERPCRRCQGSPFRETALRAAFGFGQSSGILHRSSLYISGQGFGATSSAVPSHFGYFNWPLGERGTVHSEPEWEAPLVHI